MNILCVGWLLSYLRVQRVRVGSVTYGFTYPDGGVPQGTLSGPKDFLVQINDLTTPCQIYKYVDDSNIYMWMIFEICKISASILQESANIACQWSRENDMNINANKTQELGPISWLCLP